MNDVKMPASTTTLFVDTTILFHLLIGDTQLRQRILGRFSAYKAVIAGEMSRRELRHSFVGAARYVHSELKDGSDVVDMLKWLHRNPNKGQKKYSTAAQILDSYLIYADKGEPKIYPRDRAISMLEMLMRGSESILLAAGITGFKASIDCKAHQSPLDWARVPIGLGPTCCTKVTEGTCGIEGFLRSRKKQLKYAREWFEHGHPFPESTEIQITKNLLTELGTQYSRASQLDMCAKIGDFLIALESSDIVHFLTSNYKESVWLCSLNQQRLFYLSPTNAADDATCDPTETEDIWKAKFAWPDRERSGGDSKR